jgi:hypothetical protein
VLAWIRRWQQTHRWPGDLDEKDVRSVLGEAEGLIKLLDGADRRDRAELYRALGLSPRYQKEACGDRSVWPATREPKIK